jgi:ribosomal protein RSM22 (predicted rRNA methylase)
VAASERRKAVPTVRLSPEGALREAIEAGIAGRRPAMLTARAGHLMAAYRSGELPGKPIIASGDDAAAYAAYRMPATVAAAAAAVAQMRESLPGWAPVSLLDVGAGTGAAAWGAEEELPSIGSVTLLEQSAEAISLGRAILAGSGSAALRKADWRRWRLAADGQPRLPLPATALVTAAYLLGELGGEQQRHLVELAMAAAPAIIFIEPGTPAGHRRILAARGQLLAGGFTVAAPCPHQLACPLDVPGDWCHFAARVQRSSVHRQAKGGRLSYEDEKFAFVAATRGLADTLPGGRVVRRPQQRKNLVSLSLCMADGTARERLVTKSEGPHYRAARKAAWGDRWETGTSQDAG